MNKELGKTLRLVAIILMGLTAAFTLLSGVGTSCVAFFIKREYKFAFGALYDYRWLYQTFVFVTAFIGLVGIWATNQLVRRKRTAYRDAVISLLLGVTISGIHYYASQTLRGEAAPTNIVFFTNVFTLLFFLLLKLPGIHDYINFTEPEDGADIAGGLTAFITGLFVITTALWIGPSHMSQGGENWVLVLQLPLSAVSLVLIIGGLRNLIKEYLRQNAPEVSALNKEA